MRALPLSLALLLFAVGFLGTAGTSHADICFTAAIDGAQAGTGSPGTGTGLFILSDDHTTLTYKVEWSGLLAGATAAHIHNQNEGGAVVHDLEAMFSPLTGQWTSADGVPLNAQRVSDLLAGEMYVVVHTSAFPAGEVRGQIIPGACVEVCFDATIDSVLSGTGSTATGTGSFILNHTQTELEYNIEFSGLSSPESAAHIHDEVGGGAIVHDLGLGTPKIGVWTNTDSPALNLLRVQHLLNGDLYVNIHSQMFPAGEIRGQLLMNCSPTAIVDPLVPKLARLAQNHPNPFNPTTTIDYATMERSRVQLRIYDANGRLVRTLVDEIQSARPDHVAIWDGRNDSGRAVASGIYFYRLVTTHFSESKKMVLLK